MLPLVLASQIRSGIEDFLRTSFSMPSIVALSLKETIARGGIAIPAATLSTGLSQAPLRTKPA